METFVISIVSHVSLNALFGVEFRFFGYLFLKKLLFKPATDCNSILIGALFRILAAPFFLHPGL
jgi:hypothetical protein